MGYNNKQSDKTGCLSFCSSDELDPGPARDIGGAACNPGMCLLALPVVSAGEIKEEVLCYESEC